MVNINRNNANNIKAPRHDERIADWHRNYFFVIVIGYEAFVTLCYAIIVIVELRTFNILS